MGQPIARPAATPPGVHDRIGSSFVTRGPMPFIRYSQRLFMPPEAVQDAIEWVFEPPARAGG